MNRSVGDWNHVIRQSSSQIEAVNLAGVLTATGEELSRRTDGDKLPPGGKKEPKRDDISGNVGRIEDLVNGETLESLISPIRLFTFVS